jgi:hypothetical protein
MPQVESSSELKSELSSESSSESRSDRAWYIIQQPEGHCTVAAALPDAAPKHWGPYESQGAAIARRVGLIRSGHCKPV